MAATAASASPLGASYHFASKMGKSFVQVETVSDSEENSSGDDQQQQPPMMATEQPKGFAEILESAGFMGIHETVYRKLRSMYPTINADTLTKRTADSMLANLYKCDVYHHGCNFTADSETAFQAHLASDHSDQSLYCFYCTKTDHHLEGCREDTPHAVYQQADQLIDHINEQHARLNYQCNLCFYRAFSAEHVFIHQAVEHLSNFEETLKQVIQDKKDRDELSPIESSFLEQTIDSTADSKSDDETEVENSDDDDDESDTVSSNVNIPKQSINEICKIIVCNAADSVDADSVATEYFVKHGFQLDARNLEKYANFDKFLCAYCTPESHKSRTGSSQNEDILVHIASVHNAFPILAYYNASHKVSAPSNYDFDNLREDYAENIVANFRQQLADNALARSYDDTLMSGAFEYYASLSSTTTDEASPSSKGVKRKLESDPEAGSSATTSETNSSSKRRRIFDRFLTEPALRRAKRVATAVVTAGMALGFYHLTHYLPESVQNYLN